MTEKRYKMVNRNLVGDDVLVYYLIQKGGVDVCQVFGKHAAETIVDELNNLYEENIRLKRDLNSCSLNWASMYDEEKEKVEELREEIEVCKQAFCETKENAIIKAEENKELKHRIRELHIFAQRGGKE